MDVAEKKKTSSDKRRPQRGVTAAELGRFLRQLAVLYRDTKLGNPQLSAALVELSAALIDAGEIPSGDAGRQLEFSLRRDFRKEIGQIKEMGPDEIVRQLNDPDCSKSELMVLGNVRFGITRSRLSRLSKSEVVDTIRAALDHEKSLGIISEEARRGGMDRTS